MNKCPQVNNNNNNNNNNTSIGHAKEKVFPESPAGCSDQDSGLGTIALDYYQLITIP